MSLISLNYFGYYREIFHNYYKRLTSLRITVFSSAGLARGSLTPIHQNINQLFLFINRSCQVHHGYISRVGYEKSEFRLFFSHIERFWECGH